MLDGAGLRFKVSEKQAQQRRFANAVIAKKTDSIAAHYPDREIIDK